MPMNEERTALGRCRAEHNRRAWDARVRSRQRFTKPAADEDVSALTQLDTSWLGSVAGKRVLCLAGGGGKQSAIYAAAVPR